ncbi:MAG: mannosyltransferase, partial [Solirubrobacterales bacterium]|nr:mannosyltransferase [Solirubrobacterales bacterium]
LIWYSQEARSYALMVLFAALALVGFARSIRAPSKGSLGLWALASALALCSHYFAVFLVAPQAAWLIWVLRPRRPAIVATVAVGIAGLALAPYAASQEGSSRRNGFTNIPLATRAGETALDFVASEEPDPLAGTASIDAIQIGSAALAGMLFLLAAALALSGADDAERVGAIAIGSVALASIAVPLAFAAAGLDFITPRNLIGAVVPLVVVAAIGFGARPSGRVGLAAALGGLLLFCGVDAAVYASAQMQRPDWRGAAQAIGPARAPRILVVNHNGDDPLDYYLGSAKLTKRNAPKPGVREVVALGSGPPPRPPGSGFRLATERRIPPFTLTVFRASSRVRIARPALEHVLQERDSLLVQRPR